MNANVDLERRLADYYATEAPQRVPDRVLASVLAITGSTRQRRALIRVPWRFPTMNSYAKAAIAAVLLIAAGAIGFALAGNRPPVPVLLPWTPERYAEDWPAPPRSEPPTGAPDVLLVRGDNTHWDPAERAWEGLEHVDPVGDAGSEATPAIDILEVGGPGAGLATYSIRLAGGVPLPPVDPSNRWIAYGVVVDTDGDGMPDERIGVDNMPDGQHRAWWADLATGQTKWKAGGGYGSVYDNGVSGGSLGLDTWYPSTREESDHIILRYSGTPGRYYAWASMIEDGRVVATDYAPDVGWLVEPVDPGLPLVGTTWIIGREFPSRSLTVEMWLIFTADGQLNIELCQRGDATVRITQDTMRVSNIALTGDACSAEVTEMEAEILAVLSADEFSYTVDAGILELSAGSSVLRFEGSPDPPPGF
jgi:heat shock protein HslJ